MNRREQGKLNAVRDVLASGAVRMEGDVRRAVLTAADLVREREQRARKAKRAAAKRARKANR